MQVISFGETLPTPHMGVNMTFVPPESSNPGVGDFYTVPFNHMDICKPSSKKSILFRLVHLQYFTTSSLFSFPSQEVLQSVMGHGG